MNTVTTSVIKIGVKVLTAVLTVDAEASVAPVRRETFGAFVEHLGRCVYTGIFEPGHPAADVAGFRADVLDLVREMGVSTVRYPGGNFVSGYRWEDGIGPRDERPTRLDLAWHSTEPNTFGLDEFMAWVKQAGAEPIMAVNLGTRGVQEALDLLEYCNIPQGTFLSDLRRRNGAASPYGIRTWCLGNEMDGPWQIGHRSAAEYGNLAAQTGRAMRLLDPELTLIACGSSGPDMPTFGAWEATVLQETYDVVDLISAHAYFHEEDGDLASFLACPVRLDEFIDGIVSTIDHVKATLRKSKQIDISFDEWNVWYEQSETARAPAEGWPVGPALFEQRYSVADAVVVGGLLIALMRHSDRVVSANLAQLVNVIAPIMTEANGNAWRQTTYYPFTQAATSAAGSVLLSKLVAPVVGTAKWGEVPVVDAVVTHDPAQGEMALFIVNRSVDQDVQLTVRTPGVRPMRIASATVLCDDDPYRIARVDASLSPRDNQLVESDEAGLRITLPPVSWNVVKLVTND